MTCSTCGAQLPNTGPCRTCGRAATPRRSATPWIAASAALVVVLGAATLLALRTDTVAGSAVAGARAEVPLRAVPGQITVPDRPAPADDPTTEPVETAPTESAPTETAPTETAPTETAPDVAVPDAGDTEPILGLAYELDGHWPGSFNQLAAAGAERAGAELGLEIVEADLLDETERDATLLDLMERGADPVVAVGYGWEEMLIDFAPEHPDTTFVILDGYVDEPNVHSVAFSEEEGAFLVGAAAALTSTSGRIGFLGASDDWYTGYYRAGFVAGVEAVDPDIELTVDYLGRAADPGAWEADDAARRVADDWYADGIDVIFSPSGWSSEGVIDAAVAAGPGHWYVGADYDEYILAGIYRGQIVLTSMVKRYDEVVHLVAEATLSGDLDSLPEYAGLSVDGVGYSTSGDHIDDLVPQLEEWKVKIASGEIVVPFE